MWSILGIKETKDKLEIKEAYMRRLQKINPEDDEEGFKRLRAAYEEALKFADYVENSEEEDMTPIGIWAKKIRELYNNFYSRISEDAWRELLEDEVCFAIDSREEASNKLLEFLMDYFYVPKNIWLLFDEYFSWSEKIEELYNDFHENFVNYVSDKINPNYSESLNYYSFEDIEDNKDYDAWIALFFKIQRDLNNNDFEEAKKDFENIEEYHINHPSLEYWKVRYYLITEDYENARQKGEALLKKCPNETFALYGMGEVEWQSKNFDKAKEYYSKCIEINPNEYNSKVGLADCFLETDNLDEAERLFEEALDVNSYDDYVRERLYVLYDKRIEEFEAKCAENQEDLKTKLQLGWYYYNNEKYDEIIKLCESFKPNEDDENQYYDLSSRAYFSKNNYDKALEYLDKWQENLLAEEDGNEYKQQELEMVYYQKGRIFSTKEEYESSLDFYNKVLEINENKISALNNKGFVLNKLGRFEESIVAIDKGLEINNNDVFLHMNRAEVLFNLNYYREAMDEANIAINIYQYYTKPYLIKMKIFNIYEEYEEMLSMAEELEKYNIASEETNLYKIKALSNSNKSEEAEKLAIDMLENKESDLVDKILFELAIIYYDRSLFDKALEYINKAVENSNNEEEYLYFRASTYRYLGSFGLAIKDYETIIDANKENPRYYPFLKKGQIFEELREYEKALECYKEVLALDPENRTINNSIGEMYDALDDYDNALDYYNKQIDMEKGAYYYLNRGLLYARNGKFDEAEDDYRCAIELEPENPYGYNSLGYLYERKNEHEKSIPYYKQAIEADVDKRDLRFYRNIIACYKKLDENELALEYYDKAIEDYSDDDELYYRKAKLLKKMKLYKEAIETYLKGIEVHKEQEETKINILEDFYDEISSAYKSMEEYDRAIEWSKKALEINPDSKYAYENMGRIYDDLKDYETAIKYYKLQVDIDKEKGINYLLIATAYKELGNKEEAKLNYLTSLAKFHKVEDKTPFEYSNIGSCYNGLENTSKAIEYLEMAINSELCEHCNFKECYDAYYVFGELYEREKEYEEALKYYKKALNVNNEDKSTLEAIERIEKLLK
ncbi:tetratricopeptide repeat protein [Clostridium sp. YIM B02555]|uniref:tetratricopeptide repeat protein n=1 Tax=Clostridium sp. YIM B02555 TaxID=2911968 RepID=UPI001EEE41BA|nr:tetratricopeptide repeat protein [Clostridium sp. YIM B02555]